MKIKKLWEHISGKARSITKVFRKSKLYKILSRPLVLFVLATCFAGALTGVVFMNRAGSPAERNWPVSWDLKNSDNSVLYQFSDDVFKGRGLDWTFSPQVYVFPEIPVSLVSYGVSGGDPYLYFLFVAIFNNMLIFTVLYGLTKLLSEYRARAKDILYRSYLAFIPLLALPLLADNTVFFYHLAPTYYFGAYLFCLAFPLILLSRISVKKKYLLAFGYTLTAASNPLLLIFTVPASFILALLKYLKDGAGVSIKSILLPVGAISLISLIFRKLFFSEIAAINPSSYISVDSFKGRLGSLSLLKDSLLNSRVDKVLIVVLILALVICVYASLVSSRRYMQTKGQDSIENVDLARVFLGISPFVTALVLYVLLIINPLYLWPVVGIPIVVALLIFFRNKEVAVLAILSYLLLLLILITPKSINRYTNTGRYFNYKSDLTNCLDSNLTQDVSIGYSTFSDARKTEITSDRNLLLVQLLYNGGPSGWLTNTKYSEQSPGSFFVINYNGDEKPIDSDVVSSLFGNPDSYFMCGEDVKVLVYSDKMKLDSIDRYYDESYEYLNK